MRRNQVAPRPVAVGRMALLLAIVASLATNALAIDIEIDPQHHPWGRCKPGAWRTIRVTTETFGSGRKTVTMREITSRLVRVEPDGFVLTIESQTDNKVTREKEVRFAWDGSRPNESTRGEYGLGEVDVEGKTFACQTHLLTTTAKTSRTTIKSWYNPDHAPHYLKRLIKVSGKQPRTSSMRVLRRNVKLTVLEKELLCWESEVLDSSPERKTKTRVYRSMKIPGGLVRSEAETRGGQQGTAEREQRELIAFGLK